MFDKILIKLRQWIRPVVAAFVIVLVIYAIWLFTSFPGRMTLDRIAGTFVPPQKDKIIQVYSGGNLIRSLSGPYSVQKVDDYYVLMNHKDKSKSVRLYGDVFIEENE